MKWNVNGVKFRRGCYECLIAQYDGKGSWYRLAGIATQQVMRSEFKRLGDWLGAKSCEVKPLYDEKDQETEESVGFMFKYDGTPVFNVNY